ncbi:MAG TPA: serine hydrolase [Acidimicrobiales bacterium]|nr:serine hydrolase [Acidimicrobiales bacterium]
MPPSRSYVLVDVGTGNVLAGYNEHLRVPPASLTKVLTALIAVSYLPPDAGVPGTAQSLAAYPNIVGIQKGVAWPLDEVLQALLVYSANDAAYAIAQRVSGSLDAFGAVMDRSAAQIGMSDDPVFHDPAGLDGTEGVDGGNLVSARDLAVAGRDLLSVPLLARIVREESASFVDPTGAAHDLPSMDYVFLESYVGAVGIKTGFTDRAGSCLMAAATRDGRTMLAVVMNGYNPTQTAIDLLNQGFATPVASEPTSDRLPAVALPSPLAAPSGVNHSPAGGTGHTGKKQAGASGSGDRGGRGISLTASGAGSSRAGSTAAPSHVSSPARRGLGAVVGSWPARALLLLAGAAAVLALWELTTATRLNRRRRVPAQRAAPGAAAFSSGRKRRQQLVDSYTRHERTSSFGHASVFGRR